MKGSTRASLACAETGPCANATYGKQKKRATKIMDTAFIARRAWRRIWTPCMRKVMAVAFLGFIPRAIRPATPPPPPKHMSTLLHRIRRTLYQRYLAPAPFTPARSTVAAKPAVAQQLRRGTFFLSSLHKSSLFSQPVPCVRQPLRVSEGFICCPNWPAEKSNVDGSAHYIATSQRRLNDSIARRLRHRQCSFQNPLGDGVFALFSVSTPKM